MIALYYDEADLASPGACQTGRLVQEVHDALVVAGSALGCAGCSLDGARSAGARLKLVFEVAPAAGAEAGAVAAAIAAHDALNPPGGAPLAGSVAFLRGVTQVLNSVRVLRRHHVVLDAHVHCASGDPVTGSKGAWVDQYLCAWRDDTGDVQMSPSHGVSTSSIPGLKIQFVTTADSLDVTIKTAKAATITFIRNDVEIKSDGEIT